MSDAETIRPCPLTGVAGNSDPTPYSKGEWRVVTCRETGFVYLENPPVYAALTDEFAWEKTFETEKKRRQRAEPVLSRISGALKWMRLNLKKPRLVRTAAHHIAELRRQLDVAEAFQMVDVGCGGGEKTAQIPDFLKARGRPAVTPIGVELSPILAEMAAERFAALGGRCVQSTAIEGMEKLDDDSVHLVILRSFLEHEVNPVGLLEAAQRKLMPGGRVIIKVPNFGSLNRRVRQQKWCGFRYPDHVNYFTPETLTATIERAGLAVRPRGWLDVMPTSDNMWFIAEKR